MTNKHVPTTWPHMLKRLRAYLGWTQKELAVTLDVAACTVTSWEVGARTPSGPARILIRKLVMKLPKNTAKIV